MYSIKERVRYSETDKSGHLTLTGIVNYFQDCSTFQSEDLGVGMEFLKEHHHGGSFRMAGCDRALSKTV